MVKRNINKNLLLIIYLFIFLACFISLLIWPSLPKRIENNGLIWNRFLLIGKSISNNKFEVIDLFEKQKDWCRENENLKYNILITNDLLKQYNFLITKKQLSQVYKDIGEKKYSFKVNNKNGILNYIIKESEEDGPVHWYYYDLKNQIPTNLRFGMISRGWPLICLYLSLSFTFFIYIIYLLVKFICHLIKWMTRKIII